ncbi:MAG: hypothetical protein PUA69_02960 [Erysipelotrichaceae bacterium]|nr:hypothetical protein [Erysipelotrichaceae bacterium]
MSEKKEKSSSFLSKEISFGKHNAPLKYPSKTTMNFIPEADRNSRNGVNIVWFVVFLLCLGVFVKFMVIDQLQKVNEQEAQYNEMQAEISQLTSDNKDDKDLEAQYNDIVGSFLNDDERNSMNRSEMLKMIDDDIVPHVSVKSVSVTGNQITVTTGTTNLNTVSEIISILQKDDRNGYVTVTTTSASDSDQSDLVNAEIVITYGSDTSDGGDQ